MERLTEETLRDWNHFKELLSVCEGKHAKFFFPPLTSNYDWKSNNVLVHFFWQLKDK